MLIHKRILALRNECQQGDDATRFTLTGVRFERERGKPYRAYASNGKTLVKATWTVDADEETAPLGIGVTLRGEDLAAVERGIPKGRNKLPFNTYANLKEDNIDGHAKLDVGLPESEIAVSTCEGTFPNCDAVIPEYTEKNSATIQVNLGLLRDLCDTLMKTIGEKGSENRVTITVPKNGKSPLVIKGGNAEEKIDVLALLMPIYDR